MENLNQQQFTELGKSYWGSNGVYQSQYDELYKTHVPRQGSASTIDGELIRAVSRLFYEYCNNGNCNAVDIKYDTVSERCYCCNGGGYVDDEDEEEECYDCGGYGYLEEDDEFVDGINEFFCNFISLIEDNIPNISEVTQPIREFIIQNNCTFTSTEMSLYNKLVDRVVFHIINNPNTNPLPENYSNK